MHTFTRVRTLLSQIRSLRERLEAAREVMGETFEQRARAEQELADQALIDELQKELQCLLADVGPPRGVDIWNQ